MKRNLFSWKRYWYTKHGMLFSILTAAIKNTINCNYYNIFYEKLFLKMQKNVNIDISSLLLI